MKELQPEASRVLLTGHADKQSAIQAINQVALFQYLEKPWDNAQLLLVIQSGVERARPVPRSAREGGRTRFGALLPEDRAEAAHPGVSVTRIRSKI